MDKILEFGGASKCSNDQQTTFTKQVDTLMSLITAQQPDVDAVKKAMKDLGTLTLDLEGSKAPGFFQRLETKCVLPFRDIIPAPSSAVSSALKSLRSSTRSSVSDPIPDEIKDLISFSQGEIKTDWIRIGLSAGVLFLLVVVLLLLMRKPQTEYLR